MVEYTFEHCRNPKTNSKLRFDFYLPKYNIVIEYDGQQHFKPYNFDLGNNPTNNEKFINMKYRDNIKTLYCILFDVKLIKIPYTKFKQIHDILKQTFYSTT